MDQGGELVELSGPGCLENVSTVLVDEFVAEGTAAEQPHRSLGEQTVVTLHENGGLSQPVEHVCGAADDEGVIAIQIANLVYRFGVGRKPVVAQAGGDPFGDSLGRAVTAGECD
jgi:hypothetical protein